MRRHQPAQKVVYHHVLFLCLMTHLTHPVTTVLDSLVDLTVRFVQEDDLAILVQNEVIDHEC